MTVNELIKELQADPRLGHLGHDQWTAIIVALETYRMANQPKIEPCECTGNVGCPSLFCPRYAECARTAHG